MRYVISLLLFVLTIHTCYAGGIVEAYQIDEGLRMDAIQSGSVALNSVLIDPGRYRVKLLAAQNPKLQIDSIQSQRCNSLSGSVAPSVGEWCLNEYALNSKINGREIDSFFLSDYLRRSDAVLVQNGGYMSSYSPAQPLGLVVSGGQMLGAQVVSPELNGLICFFDEGVSITSIPVRAGDARQTDCLQAGPLFLLNGISQTVDSPYFNEARRHSFVCTTESNQIVMGVSDTIPLVELADILKTKLHCANALRLSGDETIGLDSRKVKIGEDLVPLQNAIGVFRRQQ